MAFDSKTRLNTSNVCTSQAALCLPCLPIDISDAGDTLQVLAMLAGVAWRDPGRDPPTSTDPLDP